MLTHVPAAGPGTQCAALGMEGVCVWLARLYGEMELNCTNPNSKGHPFPLVLREMATPRPNDTLRSLEHTTFREEAAAACITAPPGLANKTLCTYMAFRNRLCVPVYRRPL